MDPYAHPSPSPNQPRQPNGYTSSPQPSYPRSPTGSSPVNRRALPTPPSTAASASPMSSPPPLDNPNPSAAGPTPGVAGVNNYKTHKQGAPSNSSFTTALDNLAHFNPTFSVGNLGLGLGVGIPNGNGDRNGSGNVNGEEEVLGGGENVIPEMWTSSAPPISNPVVSTPAPPNPTPIPVNGDAHSQPISSPDPGLLNPSPNHGGASSTPPRKSLDAPLSPSQQQQSIPSTPSSPSARSPRSPAPPTSFPAYLSTELTPLHSSTPTPNAVMGGMNLSNRALEAGTPGPSAAGAGAPGVGTGGVKGAVRKRTVSGESKKSGVIVAGQEGEGGGGEELLRKASLYYSTSVAAAQMRSLSPEPSSIPVPIQERAGGGGMPNSQSAPNMRTSISTPARARDRREEQQQQPQPRRAPQPVQQEEVCIECMMRDQDMIDVDVTSPGIWARASDADFEEALRTEEEEEIRTNDERGGRSRENFEGSSVAHSRDGLAGASASASNLHGSGSGSKEGGRKRKKIGRGQRLTTPALRLWTNMNPPASNFRWKTLQTYLATQAHYLELERHAREASAADRERADRQTSVETAQRYSMTGTLDDRLTIKTTSSRNRTSTLLPNGMTMEKVDTRRDEREARRQKKRSSGSRSRGNSIVEPQPYNGARLMPNSPISPSSPPSVMSYDPIEPPWISGPKSRRFSSPVKISKSPAFDRSPAMPFQMANQMGARSSTDLRTYSASLAPSLSPSRMSMGGESRLSLWSRGRRSATHSMLSLAPSGSMMDMHLGLYNDKHLPLGHGDPRLSMMPGGHHGAMSMQDVRAQSPETYGTATTVKKKRKGLKAILSMLNIKGGDKKESGGGGQQQVHTPQVQYQQYDNDVLAPPPSMNMLARDHQRSRSSSSVNSLPPGASPVPYSPAMTNGQLPADRRSVMSYNSVASKLLGQGQPGPYPSHPPPAPLRRPSDTISMSSRRGVPNAYEHHLSPSPNTYQSPVIALPPDAINHPNSNQRNSVIPDLMQPQPANGIRKEKSLPALPPPEGPYGPGQEYYQGSRSGEEMMPNGYFGMAASPNPNSDYDWENNDGRSSRQAKTKSKLLGFGLKKKKSRDLLEQDTYAPAPEILHAVSREAPLLAFRY